MALTQQLLSEIQQVAKQYNLPVNYYMGMIRAESDFSMGSSSSAGAIGYTQLMPGTARGLGVDPYNPHQNLVGGAKYLRAQLDKFGNMEHALAAYNAGPGAVAKYGGIPPYAETQAYVKRVMQYAQGYKGYGGGNLASMAASNPLGATPNAAPTINISSPELARAPTFSSLAPGPLRGAMGASVRSPNLTIAPLQIARPTISAAPSFMGSGADTSGASGVPASGGYPLGVHGKIIGTPHSGTHNLGNWQSDNAIDIAVPVGTPVYASFDGVIGSRIGSLGKGGRFAGLRLTLQGAGDAFYYAHLSRLTVSAGQRVKRGQLLGYSGSANGVAHLHLGAQSGDPRNVFGG